MFQKIWFVFFITAGFFCYAGDDRVEIASLRQWTHPTHTRIAVDVGQIREYTYNQLKAPDRIYIDIYQARLNPILHGKSYLVQNKYLSQIRIAQKSYSTVRIVADVDFENIKHYHVFHLPDPFRVVIDIYPKLSTTPTLEEKVPQPPLPTDSGYSMARQLGLGIKRIVIDPGHGGKDPGCIGSTGLKEKSVVLDIATRLKNLLSSNKNLETILTRETDIFLPLEDRTVIAAQKQADIFISIHANSHRNQKTHGIETFYLNFSQDKRIMETAARENTASTKSISQMSEILRKISRNSKILESKEMAEKIQNNLVQTLSRKYKEIKSLGVKGGPFWVLIGTEVPSILVEVSYLSNPHEERYLKDKTYLQEIAQGIYNGIMEYIHSLGKG
ncbi:MAG: N-acetylmuramoyl-L-alanine amidase [Candidatus Aminicenantes bacterium]|nr:N-acetylmuramoyl-L-alanine amidase [Candidatus Aminicenantes bacterium]